MYNNTLKVDVSVLVDNIVQVQQPRKPAGLGLFGDVHTFKLCVAR